MNHTFRLAAAAAVSVPLGLLLPGVVRAQDAGGGRRAAPDKSQADLDRELDETLSRTHGDPNEPPPPHPHEDLAPNRPPAEAPLAVEGGDTDAGRFRFRLGAMGAHWMARLYDVSVSKGKAGGPVANLNLDDGSHDFKTDWEYAQTQTYRAWIDLGDMFSIEGAGRNAVFRREGNSASNFTFGRASFFQNEFLKAKFEFTSVDLSLVVHPINCEMGQLDVFLGARYLWSDVKIQGTSRFAPTMSGFPFPAPAPRPLPNFSFPANQDSQTVEAILPMLGLGGAIRPIHFGSGSYFEIFARARVGGIDWENESGSKEYYAVSFEAEGGIAIVFSNFIGLMAGYRFEYNEIERANERTFKYATWKSDGPFGGVLIQF
ncbi:hypothetical protein HY251_00070 [bacterium]|nr:hypothetical protein [bacterium]